MSLAFVADTALSLRRSTAAPLAPCSLHGRRVRLARSRRVQQLAACLPANPESDSKEEEAALDEAAMRAAEIHEVLTGLREFKTRIIDDATRLAKKVRAPKKQLEAALKSHPDINKIDTHIAKLEEELKWLGDR